MREVRNRLERTHRDPAALTPAEQRIADLVAQGKSNAEIALALGLSAHTISFRKSTIKQKQETAA